MSAFDLDFGSDDAGLARQLLPDRLRGPKRMAWLVCLLAAIEWPYENLMAFRAAYLYQLAHGPQVCHIQGWLNDTFDNVERRIYISNGVNNIPNYLYQQDELKPVYLAQQSEVGSSGYASPDYLFTQSETDAGGANFIVNVPTVVAGEAGYDVNYLIAIVNSLKLPNKSFTVVEF